jgi:hypothetical protein
MPPAGARRVAEAWRRFRASHTQPCPLVGRNLVDGFSSKTSRRIPLVENQPSKAFGRKPRPETTHRGPRRLPEKQRGPARSAMRRGRKRGTTNFLRACRAERDPHPSGPSRFPARPSRMPCPPPRRLCRQAQPSTLAKRRLASLTVCPFCRPQLLIAASHVPSLRPAPATLTRPSGTQAEFWLPRFAVPPKFSLPFAGLIRAQTPGHEAAKAADLTTERIRP